MAARGNKERIKGIEDRKREGDSGGGDEPCKDRQN